MKLTKDDFDYDEGSDVLEIDITEDMNIIGEDFYNSVRDQILKNQSDAEKLQQYQKENWISIPKADFECIRKEEKESRLIVERLKKRIEDLKVTSGEPVPDLLSQLQKILEEKE